MGQMAWAQVRAAGGGRVNTSSPLGPPAPPRTSHTGGGTAGSPRDPPSLRPFSRQPLPQASQGLSDRVCVHTPLASL